MITKQKLQEDLLNCDKAEKKLQEMIQPFYAYWQHVQGLKRQLKIIKTQKKAIVKQLDKFSTE